MPDWTYHPLFKPLLFRLPAEWGRRLTLRLLAVQGRTAVGRAVFRLFGHVHPPREVAVSALGRTFASPVGLGAGIDTHGVAVSVMQYLGFGFLEVGPAGARATPARRATEPRRLEAFTSIVASESAAAPSAAELAGAIRAASALAVPVGIAVRGPDVEQAARDASRGAAFVTLPEECTPALLERLRAACACPLLLRLSPDLEDGELDRAVSAALEAGIDGFVIGGGSRSTLLPEGRLFGPGTRERELAMVRRVRASCDRPVVGAGSIASPADALAFLEAGATLVSLYDGLVYAGPGLPGRILRALGSTPAEPAAAIAQSSRVPRWSWWMIAFTGLVLVLAGLFALFLAATDHMLPPDVAYLGMTATELCAHHDCRIVRFMVHDRVAFAGSILTVGLVYGWLAATPLRRGEAWAWWTLVVSGGIGFGSFLTYLGYGYLDPWHAVATLLLLPWFVAGLAGSFHALAAPRGPACLRRLGARAWRWSPAGMGRAALGFAAFGMVSGGFVIMTVGMTQVFVPQDLGYMKLTVAELDAVNPRLVSLIAHDRAGFGGGLASGGLAIAACLAYGLRPGAPALWAVLLLGGLVGFGTAIGIHFIVGYTDFFHLLPAYAGALGFLVGMRLLHPSMCRADPADRFSDFR